MKTALEKQLDKVTAERDAALAALAKIAAGDNGRSASGDHTVCYSCAETHLFANQSLEAVGK